MKRKIALLLLSLTLMLTCSCSNNSEESAEYIAGTYTGVSEGRNGEIEVSVTLSETRIDEVVVVSHQETANISDSAIQTIPEKVVETQSLSVDIISGATITSEAVLLAIEDALINAGVDTSTLMSTQNESDIVFQTEELTTDVVIVGAGGAGLTAAMTLSENGVNVILLEKMSYTGGSAGAAGGGLYVISTENQNNLNKQNDAEAFKEYVMSYGHDYNNPVLVDIYANNIGSAVDYLQEEQNVAMTYWETDAIYGRYTLDGNGATFTSTLTDNIMNVENVDLMLNTEATALIVEDGNVVGVKAIGQDGIEYEVYAQATLLTTGGFSCNEELLGDNIPESAINYGVSYLTGDGLLMAQEVGAAVDNMDLIALKAWGIETGDGTGIYTMNQSVVTSSTGSILVNNKGVRVMDEQSGEALQKDIYLEQEDQCMYLLMNQNGYDTFLSTATTFTAEQANEWLNSEENQPLLVSGDTIEEVAIKANIDSDALAETVRNYDEMFDAGVDTDFNHEMSEKIGDGPYYILKFSIRYCQTLGGLVANENLEILDDNNNAIPGLYGAGEVVGSSSGDEAFSILAWAISSGYYVANHLSEIIQ